MAGKVNVTDSLLTSQQIIATLSQHRETLRRLGARNVGLFGSYRRGTANPDSDVDILVTLEKSTFDSYMDIKLFLEELFQKRVDLTLEKNIKDRLRPIILDEVLYVEGL